jgi:hypothetical protein
MKKTVIAAVLTVGGLIAVPALLPLVLRNTRGDQSDEVGELIDEIKAGGQPSGWIVAESAALMDVPTGSAQVVTTLARGTPLVVGAEAGGWAQVRIYGRTLEGWVPSAAIGTAQDAMRKRP